MMGFEMLGGSETVRLNEIIRGQRVDVDARDVQSLLRAARASKPAEDYDGYIDSLRRAYAGDHRARLAGLLARRYPKTWQQMPHAPVDVVTETAEIDAQLYRTEPLRWLSDEDTGLRLDDADPSARSFATMIARAEMHPVMLEVERMASIAEVAFVRSHYSDDVDAYGKPRIVLRPFWSSQVHVVPGPEAPERVSAASFVLLQISGAGTEDGARAQRRYEIWSRGTVDVDGVTVRVWRYMRVDEDGKNPTPWAMHVDAAGRVLDLPIASFHVRYSSSLYPEPNRSLMATQDTINVANSDFWYSRSYNAHKVLGVVGAGSNKKGQQSKLGPDAVFSVEEQGATVSVLDMQGDLSTQEAIDRALTQHGRTRRQPVSAWHTKTGNPETGVARQVANESADQKRAEHARLFASCERTLLAIMSRQTDGFGDMPPIDVEGVEYNVRYAAPAFFEDPTARAQRILLQLSQRLMSPARAAVDMGIYATEAEAVAIGLSTSLPPPYAVPESTAEVIMTATQAESAHVGGTTDTVDTIDTNGSE